MRGGEKNKTNAPSPHRVVLIPLFCSPSVPGNATSHEETEKSNGIEFEVGSIFRATRHPK